MTSKSPSSAKKLAVSSRPLVVQQPHIQSGDRVTLLWEGMYATKLRIDRRLAVHIPDSVSFEEVDALPMVHTTAYHAVISAAKLRPGQSVLVHAAAGGVGQAALHLAAHLGLVAYATVDSEHKRRLLVERYNVPEAHIFHSRDTSFAKAIKRITGGRGVHCVLNSLSGELLRAHGRALWHVPRDRSARCHEQHAVPADKYPGAELETAFRTMHGASIVGNSSSRLEMILRHTYSAKLSRQSESPNSTYLFVGGLGGLGRSFAREFVACGARHIAFISRLGDSSADARITVQPLTTFGAVTKAYHADVADEPAFLSAMQECVTDFPPIAGVVQMAMILRDTLFEKIFGRNPCRPRSKANSIYITTSPPPQRTRWISSSSAPPSPASSATQPRRNTPLQTLSKTPLPAAVVVKASRAWRLTSVSCATSRARHNGRLAHWEAILGIREKPSHALMKSLINSEWKGDSYPAQVCTDLGTANVMARFGLVRSEHFGDPPFGPLNVLSYIFVLVPDTSSAASSPYPRLAAASALDEAVSIITDAFVHETAGILQIPLYEVDPDTPMYRYEVASLVALEVRNWITRELQANMALLKILAAEPMKMFAGKIAKQNGQWQSAGTVGLNRSNSVTAGNSPWIDDKASI
ncbi:Lovastatin diketide synthase LovF [Penicillium chrysogenum]|uniref:Lovastatin diketide synthase LovF n=1 Tax=Penicillium chrysogenum TaxID=5076 RepID=A0A167PVL0_PENCH|nr:Lovastatin diketide synthase LovF [Penicillium chrysogenum]